MSENRLTSLCFYGTKPHKTSWNLHNKHPKWPLKACSRFSSWKSRMGTHTKHRTAEFSFARGFEKRPPFSLRTIACWRQGCPNIMGYSGLLRASFSHRHKRINSLTGRGAVKKVLEEYPGFNWYNQASTTFFLSFIPVYLIYLNLKNGIPQMLLHNFLCVVLILGFPSLIQAYDWGETCYWLCTVWNKHGRGYSHNCRSTQKKTTQITSRLTLLKNLMEKEMEKLIEILMKTLMMVSSLNMYYLCPCLCYGQLITSINYFAILYIHSQGSRPTVANSPQTGNFG